MNTPTWIARLVYVLAGGAALFTLAGLIENLLDGGPRAITINGLSSLLLVGVTVLLMRWLRARR